VTSRAWYDARVPILPSHPTRGVFRATVSGPGAPGPIEERIGRRLVRLVEPDSEEGRRLLHERAVDLIGPGGKSLGRIGIEEAYARLERRLASRLATEPAARRRPRKDS